jgi:asparagine synthase (glutamine-hydrolysing)
MSGQAGIYYYDHRPIDRSLADRLGAGLSRQGPDGGDQRSGNGLLMVYRAFHVEPESYLEQQPYVSPQGNWTTWDGRLDNRDDLLLLVKDHLQDDTTDVALAMAAYEKWGEPGFNRLIGDWSLALWDEARRLVVLASDYARARALFYYTDNDCIAWSSDLGLLVSWMGLENDLDNYYIAAVLTGGLSYDRTIYRQICFVPPGHTVHANGAKPKKTAFWHPPVETRIRYRNDSDYEEHLLNLFRQAVLHRLRTNHPVCCDLSGGLDSSSVTCMAHELIRSGTASPKRLVTFSWIDPDMDDNQYIEIVEKYCGIESIRMDFGQFWSLDAPSTTMPMRSDLAKAERGKALRDKDARAYLTGFAGDVTMGNILEDTDQLADSIRSGKFLKLWIDAYAWSRAMRVTIWHVLTLGGIPLLPLSTQQRLWKKKSEVYGGSYGHFRKRSIVNQEFACRYSAAELPPYASEYRGAVPSQRIFLYGLLNYQVDPLLNLYQNLEPAKWTHPYLDRRLVEFVAAIPRSQLCRAGRPRDLMRRAFAGFLPAIVRERRTKALDSTANDKSILDLSACFSQGPFYTETCGYVDGSGLRGVLNNPQAPGYDRNELTRVLTLEVWLRTRMATNGFDTGTTGHEASRARDRNLLSLG